MPGRARCLRAERPQDAPSPEVAYGEALSAWLQATRLHYLVREKLEHGAYRRGRRAGHPLTAEHRAIYVQAAEELRAVRDFWEDELARLETTL